MRFLPTLAAIWDLRRHPRRRVRIALWVGLLCVAGLLLAPGWFRLPLLYAWYGVNGGLALISAAWGAAHPRAVLRHGRVTLRWAFWLTLILAPFFYSLYSAQMTEQGVSLSLLYIALGTLALFGGFFLTYCLIGLLGQCVAAFVSRELPEGDDRPTREGLAAWWLCIAGGFLGLALSNLFLTLRPINVFIGLTLGLPLYTLMVCTLARTPTADPETRLRALLGRISRQLSLSRLRPGRIVDLRGAALGLFWALIVLVLSEGGLLTLPQGVGLITLVQLYNIEPGLSFWLDPEENAVQTQRERIILLNFDSEARRKALTEQPGGKEQSEAAIQAALIDKLKSWGAACVVLPFPPWEGKDNGDFRTPDAAEPTLKDAQRSHADLPLLIKAMRKAGNVVLAVPTHYTLDPKFPGDLPQDERSLFPDAKGIGGPVRGVGLADLDGFGTPQLPAIRVGKDWTGVISPRSYPAAPISIAALVEGVAPTVHLDPKRPSEVEIAETRLPMVILGQVLVDFHSDQYGQDFRHIDVSSVLNSKLQYVRPPTRPVLSLLGRRRRILQTKKKTQGNQSAQDNQGARAGWTSPARFFRGKIVVLDTLTPQVRDTPVGVKPLLEVLAYAAATLLAGHAPHPVSPFFFVPTVLLLGMLAGHLSLRRTPIDAGWRVAATGILLFVVSLVLFLRSGARLWFDPTTPALAMLAAYLQVTQFAFSQERHERERNRDLLQRFVAPQVVDELLDNPEGKLGLGGSRQRLCVLFADGRNFTPFTERHSPEEVIEVINSYMTALIDTLYLYEGILDKYTGDGLLALFRVKSPREDVTRAVQGALAMRDAALQVSRQRQAQGLEPLQMGFALHYGEAVVGLVGNPRRFEYTALGHTVVVCARLQTLAGGGELVVSEAVAEVVGDAFPFEPGEPVHVKGIGQPIRPYRIPPPPQALPEPALPGEAVVHRIYRQ